MNLFQIDFIQGKTDAPNYNQIVHSLVDLATERKVITLAVSSDKLQGGSSFAREPKRLTFECFVDDWITEYLFSGDYEHERYISHYEIRAYRDDVLIFSGIIDTSNMNDNVAEEIVSFLCYDKIKLFSIYNDLQQFYALSAGYQPAQILAYFAQKITQRIPISVPVSSSGFSVPGSLIPVPDTVANSVRLQTIDISEMCTKPANAGGWTYSWDSGGYVSPKHGYRTQTLANRMTYVMGHKKVVKGYFSEQIQPIYRATYKAVVVELYSGLSMVVKKHDFVSAWTNDYAQIQGHDQNFAAFFTTNGLPAGVLNNLSSSGVLNGTNFYSYYAENTELIPWVYGAWLPSYLHPGKFYETGMGTELTNCLKVLQAVLLLYNATLLVSTSGTVILKSKEQAVLTPIVIADADVVHMARQRANAEVPDMSGLDVLCGDTAVLQRLAKAYLMDFHAGKWKLTGTIDRLERELALGDYIKIKGITYCIVDLRRDYVADDYKIIAWKVS